MIFCVEDEANIRELVVYTLETTGFEARGFEEGTSFFEALASCCFFNFMLCTPSRFASDAQGSLVYA